MDYLQYYGMLFGLIGLSELVLNLIINGLPSIQQAQKNRRQNEFF